MKIIGGMMIMAIASGAIGAEADVLVVTQNTELDPAKSYRGIVIKGSNLTLDGNGALVMPAEIKKDTKEYRGNGIFSDGTNGVTLKNIKVKGWETGLRLKDVSGWTVENCDFSDNFHDPAFGWGENGRRGGIVVERMSKSSLRKNKANRVWDACVLIDSNDNVVEENDFSRTSDTCLKLWTACRNTFRKNNFSYGVRIAPGEVHARDSSSVLIESGANDNKFIGNDCTHGGDGIFIRVLNQWVSTGNYFEENDTSYAHNNCVESWSPGSTWVRNKANHGSYGFWLGGADRNVLLENEASFNGLKDGNHNSPHLPDSCHSGIVYMFGPSSHTIVRGNTCEGNNGAGIAAIGDLDSKGVKWNAFHWIIEQNKLTRNRWGIYLQHADMFDLAGNKFTENRDGDVWCAENVSGLRERTIKEGGVGEAPKAVLTGPETAAVGQRVMFDASKSNDPSGAVLSYRWRIAPNVNVTKAEMPVTFPAAGFYRVALTVSNGKLSDLAWRDVYAIEKVNEFGTEEKTDGWDWVDSQSKVKFALDEECKLIGRASVRARVEPYGGGRVTVRYTPPAAVALAGKTTLVFWLKARNENVPAWQDVNPLLTLTGADGKELQLAPVKDFLSQPPHNEARDGWLYFAVPLAGNAQWKRAGNEIGEMKSVGFGFDSWGAPPLTIWVDGLGVK